MGSERLEDRVPHARIASEELGMMDVAQVGSNATQRGYVPLRWVAAVFVPLVAFVYLAGLTASPDDAGVAYQTFAAVAIVIMFTVVIVFCVLAHRRYVGTPLLGWPGWRRFLLELLIAIPVAVAWALALSWAASLSPELMRMADPTGTLYRPVIIAPVVYCLAGFTMGPLAEEMLYRAVLYGSLRHWIRPVFAIVLQALMFGMMHRYGLLYMSMAFASGLVFMGMYLWRRTLWSPVLVHAMINAVGIIPLLVMLLAFSSHVILGIDTADTSPQPGARVVGVMAGSLAQEADLRIGDIITAIDSLPIHQANDVPKTIKAHKPGDTIHLTLVRAGHTLDIAAKLRALRPHILW